ncbi:hypothetical protein JMUB5695_02257 [Mycobacterium heckeshornense]|uniref:hypothetical protein n=1 Tax=Mycobacterium heckeshornense TaxID=110505 RepID=UPI0019445010|nr:hypothetical protein [Mycobacterium heckeshornense]BCQ08818.1 hypothetical protein JMUB5695_02257 [Mycobacterium heckeshornense]
MRAAQAEVAQLRAHADDFRRLAEKLDAMRLSDAASDTELMRRLIGDCRSWSQTLRSASSYRECVIWWYRRRRITHDGMTPPDARPPFDRLTEVKARLTGNR